MKVKGRQRGPALTQLVAATRERHLRLERTRLSRALLGAEPGLTRLSYGALLHAMLGISEELIGAEQRGLLAALPLACRPQPHRVRALHEDLRELGVAHGQLSPWLRISLVEVRRRVRGLLISDASTLGWQYVWQGSELGGEVIAPRIDRELRLHGAATRWYAGDVEKRVAFARLCVAIEGRVDAGLVALDEVILGAEGAFCLFEQLWMQLEETFLDDAAPGRSRAS